MLDRAAIVRKAGRRRRLAVCQLISLTFESRHLSTEGVTQASLSPCNRWVGTKVEKPEALKPEYQGAVVSVLDGETIEVLHYTSPERVRLSGIDCPEKVDQYNHFSTSCLAVCSSRS